MLKHLTVIFFCSFISATLSAQSKRPVDYVNPFIGTENDGNVFPGPSMPFGMVKLSPDCYKNDRQNINPGYASTFPVYGFSHTHVSGTGGGPKYGNILVMPMTGSVNVKDRSTSISNEDAKAGYYTAFLAKYNIKAELTATHSVGVHRYVFPQSNDAHIIIDAGSFLYNGGEVQSLVHSAVKIISPTEISGYGEVRGGWNQGAPYTVYFYAIFDTPAKEFGVWRNDHIMPDSTEMKPRRPMDYSDAGAYFSYNTKTNQIINIKVGISFISIEKAKENITKETSGKTFDDLVYENKNVWNKLLNRIEIEGATEDQKQIFYTGLYHTMLMPVDRTNENPLWKSAIPYYDDFYAIWDTYRTSNPLLTLICTQRQVDLINSLIDIYKHEGYMPDARSGNYNGLTQSGSNCDMLIADAYLKGLSGINYKEAYEAMIKNAEVQPANDLKEGRGGLEDYKALGYVPAEHNRSGSRTLEYAYNDWAIAQVAKGLNKQDDYNKYTQRASNWKNLWRPVNDHGATGFIWPKRKDGTWVDDYSFFKFGYWDAFLYESHTWEYSFFVPHDVKGLINAIGGKEKFINRLDTFFINNYFRVQNEPGFLTPCLYLWAGRYDKTAERVHAILKNNYNTTRGGLPGNDDSGAMSAWYIFHSMGFYPNAGQDVYLLTTPLFSKSVMHMENGKDFTISAKKLNDKNIYIQSAKLNGKNLDQAWFRHTDIKNGGELELIMGNKPSAWGTKNPPPSLSE